MLSIRDYSYTTMLLPTVQSILDHLLATLGWGSVITFFGSLAWFLLKLRGKATDLVSTVTAEWQQARQDIRDAKTTLDLAVGNHLAHVEAATATTAVLMQRQNGMLGRLVDSTAQNAVTLGKIETLLDLTSRPPKQE